MLVVTDMDTAAGEGLRRRRSGGRDGHARSALPDQRPWAQPRMRYRPTEVVSADELEAIHSGSLRVLAEIGMDFLDAGRARGPPRRPGAQVEPGTPAGPVRPGHGHSSASGPRPRRSRSMPGTRRTTSSIGGDWIAFGTVGSPPNVADLDRGRRIGNREDYQNLLRLAPDAQPGPLPGRATRSSRSTSTTAVRHLYATFDALTLMDKPIHAYSLGRQRNIDALEMARIARGIDAATLDREPSIFTVVNSSSPLRLDTPMLQGIMEFAAHNQVVVHHAVHARRARWRR